MECDDGVGDYDADDKYNTVRTRVKDGAMRNGEGYRKMRSVVHSRSIRHRRTTELLKIRDSQFLLKARDLMAAGPRLRMYESASRLWTNPIRAEEQPEACWGCTAYIRRHIEYCLEHSRPGPTHRDDIGEHVRAIAVLMGHTDAELGQGSVLADFVISQVGGSEFIHWIIEWEASGLCPEDRGAVFMVVGASARLHDHVRDRLLMNGAFVARAFEACYTSVVSLNNKLCAVTGSAPEDFPVLSMVLNSLRLLVDLHTSGFRSDIPPQVVNVAAMLRLLSAFYRPVSRTPARSMGYEPAPVLRDSGAMTLTALFATRVLDYVNHATHNLAVLLGMICTIAKLPDTVPQHVDFLGGIAKAVTTGRLGAVAFKQMRSYLRFDALEEYLLSKDKDRVSAALSACELMVRMDNCTDMYRDLLRLGLGGWLSRFSSNDMARGREENTYRILVNMTCDDDSIFGVLKESHSDFLVGEAGRFSEIRDFGSRVLLVYILVTVLSKIRDTNMASMWVTRFAQQSISLPVLLQYALSIDTVIERVIERVKTDVIFIIKRMVTIYERWGGVDAIDRLYANCGGDGWIGQLVRWETCVDNKEKGTSMLMRCNRLRAAGDTATRSVVIRERQRQRTSNDGYQGGGQDVWMGGQC